MIKNTRKKTVAMGDDKPSTGSIVSFVWDVCINTSAARYFATSECDIRDTVMEHA
jgi:hypothetical protein